jgi:hypothetical protein
MFLEFASFCYVFHSELRVVTFEWEQSETLLTFFFLREIAFFLPAHATLFIELDFRRYCDVM